MTSNFARNQRLSQQTLDAYMHLGARPRDTRDRLYFYLVYLQDVVPDEVTVHHIPDRTASVRHQIHLKTPSGPIFMSGLVGKELNHHYPEDFAGDAARAMYSGGKFIPDEENWRFFTGLNKIRFFRSHDDEDWDRKGEWHPIRHAQDVAAYLQREYDRLEYH